MKTGWRQFAIDPWALMPDPETPRLIEFLKGFLVGALVYWPVMIVDLLHR